MVKITGQAENIDKLNVMICLVSATIGFVLVLSCVVYLMSEMVTEIQTHKDTIQEQQQEIETLREANWIKQEKIYGLFRINELLPVLEQVLTKQQISEIRALGEVIKQEKAKK